MGDETRVLNLHFWASSGSATHGKRVAGRRQLTLIQIPRVPPLPFDNQLVLDENVNLVFTIGPHFLVLCW